MAALGSGLLSTPWLALLLAAINLMTLSSSVT
jgi:hypothetical protein